MDDQAGPSSGIRCYQEHEDVIHVTKGIPVNKRLGTNNEGSVYEKYVLLWVLLNLLEDTDVQEFLVADNVDGVGAFDDIVIRVKRNVPGEGRIVSELICVQLKHKENIVKKITWQEVTGKNKSAYHLLKYYEDYKKIILRTTEKHKDSFLGEYLEEEITLVLYSNASFEFEEDIYDKSSFNRKILESKGEHPSMVFDFRNKIQEIKSSLCLEENAVQNFVNKLIIFSQQSNAKMLREKLMTKISDYFPNENVSLEHAVLRAVEFTKQNNSMWLSRHSGVLFDIIFKFQGVPVKLADIAKLWDLPTVEEEEEKTSTDIVQWKHKKFQFINKIIVQHMCLDETIEHLSVGEPLKVTELYYVDRTLLKYTQYVREYSYYDAPEVNRQNNIKIPCIQRGSVVLLCAGPGMGKSSYFTYQANLLKSKNPKRFVIRKNLVDFSKFLQDLDVNEDLSKIAMEFLLKLSGIALGTAEHDLFELCLKHNKEMVLFLDGVDEISPHYYEKLLAIILTIRKEFDVEMWISTRTIMQERMEKDLGITALILKEFEILEILEFLDKYCDIAKIIGFSYLPSYIKGVPIFCKMFGDIIKSNPMENLNDITNEADLYDKFVDTMYDVYNEDKKNLDLSIPAIKRDLEKLKKSSMDDHTNAALLEVFDKKELSILGRGIWNKSRDFLEDISAGEEKAGLIINVVDGKPRFIHRTIAEYFCGRWFLKNPDKYHKYVKIYKLPREVDFHMTCKLNDLPELFKFIILRKEDKINQYLEESVGALDIVDSLGRDVIYYVDRFPHLAVRTVCNIISRANITKEIVQNMTHFYNKVTRTVLCSYLLFSFFDTLDIENCPGYRLLIRLILIWLVQDNKSFDSFLYCVYLKYCKNLPVHVKTINMTDIYSDIKSLKSKENINSKYNLGLTALHFAAAGRNIPEIKRFCQHGAEYSNDNILNVYPHHFYLDDVPDEIFGTLHGADFIIKKEFTLIENVKTEDYVAQNLPLHDAVQKNDLDRVKKVVTGGFNDVDVRGRTALHVAAACFNADFDIIENLCSKNINYTRDENGLYAHDYFRCEKRRLFMFKILHYGISRQLSNLPKSKQKIHGKRIEDIVFEMGQSQTTSMT